MHKICFPRKISSPLPQIISPQYTTGTEQSSGSRNHPLFCSVMRQGKTLRAVIEEDQPENRLRMLPSSGRNSKIDAIHFAGDGTGTEGRDRQGKPVRYERRGNRIGKQMRKGFTG